MASIKREHVCHSYLCSVTKNSIKKHNKMFRVLFIASHVKTRLWHLKCWTRDPFMVLETRRPSSCEPVTATFVGFGLFLLLFAIGTKKVPPLHPSSMLAPKKHFHSTPCGVPNLQWLGRNILPPRHTWTLSARPTRKSVMTMHHSCFSWPPKNPRFLFTNNFGTEFLWTS